MGIEKSAINFHRHHVMNFCNEGAKGLQWKSGKFSVEKQRSFEIDIEKVEFQSLPFLCDLTGLRDVVVAWENLSL
jgi:hypothetical protein